ncbi:MAG TPA: branched-chain amino acid ABC transporter permease [Treponema sp.]|nr:branched-chain amino acid ABC transporter permease [Treponema sp.]
MMSELIKKFRTGRYFGIAVLVVMALFFWGIFKLLSPGNFGSPKLMTGYLQTSIQYAVGGCGLYFIVVMGLFDFSIGANVVLSSLVGVLLSRHFGYFGLIFGCVLCGTLIGCFNGTLYSKLRIPSMIVTVGLMLVLESVANYVVSLDVSGFPGKLTDENILAFNHAPWNYVVAAGAFLLMFFILRFTKIGTYCNAIGSNELVAKNMGINVEKYKFVGFVLLHFFVGIMALLTVSYGRGMLAVTGMASMDRNFKPLMGTFFGVAFKKYGCPVTAIVIGEFIITMIFNGLVALNVPTTINDFVTGAVLLIIVTLTNRGLKGSVVK